MSAIIKGQTTTNEKTIMNMFTIILALVSVLSFVLVSLAFMIVVSFVLGLSVTICTLIDHKNNTKKAI